ncbi:MarR family winged helix-turn-helix transcriptional regulator [Falsibacillus pallidus]|uniref:DNA-binding MarR family transcriptional regulator n=1 Tax=Falsibacillus pallidus TaxID=493781 RepID=A0A370GE46_9BACI|nr:winged helix-turn-helix transcriptional regulator [Falsibacillus pallidus]RDI41951.1 DNA-binding MarR family transcriptional regulator [Falsibacillus pallidus]
MLDGYFKNCLYFSANRLSRIMTKMAEESFAPIGLSPTYAFLIMAALEEPGLTQKRLSEKLHIAPSTCTRFVDKLEVKLLVERKQEGKMVYIHPTSKAEDLLPEIKKCWKQLYERYCDLLGKEMADQLSKDLHNAGEILE